MKRKSTPAGVLIVLVLGLWIVRSHQPATSPASAAPSGGGAPSVTHALPDADASGPRESAPYRIAGVRIVDINTGETLPVRTVDLRPTLERVAAGDRNAHRNDGSVFRNAERKLPQKPSGYYREYVVPTDGVRGPGPQRLIVGREGEVYYTHDHYETFIRVRGDT